MLLDGAWRPEHGQLIMRYAKLGDWAGDLWYFQAVGEMYREKAHEVLRVTGDTTQFHGRMRMARQYMRIVRQMLTEQ